jgi:hypothetical protein
MFNDNNRITRAITSVRAKLDLLDVDEVLRCNAAGSIDATEHAAYQEAKSQAQADGVLMVDEAEIVYRALGPSWSQSNGGWSDNTDAATKIVVTHLIAELLEARRLAATS